MDRATFKTVVAVGVLLNSALYLSACLALGVIAQRPMVWRLALAAIGVTYLSYLLHSVADHDAQDAFARLARLMVYLSIALGVLAGLALLF